MRISLERGDQDYDHSASARVLRVTLDGEPVLYWRMADEERGLVICGILDERGFPVLTQSGGAALLATHWRSGVVKIELKDTP